MSFVLFLTALVAVPAAIGLLLPTLLRRVAAVAAAATAIALFAAGLNVHGPSTPIFLLCAGTACGFLLVELARFVRRLFGRRLAHG